MFKLACVRLLEVGSEYPFPEASVSLITCCMAAHWMDMAFFFKQADRILQPGKYFCSQVKYV